MLKVKLFKTQIGFSFSFFAVIALIQLIQGTNYFLFALSACILHELGHIVMMCLFNVAPKQIIFYGAGIKITPDNSKITSVTFDFLILIAGVVTNFLLFLILYFCFQKNFNISLFAMFNLIIGVFNILPFKHFDGGKIIELILNSTATKHSYLIRKSIRIISIFLLIIFGIAFGYYQGINISLYFTILYIIISEIML